MDTFTSLPDGSTSGDAELQDIRVGYDGTTYDTAGNAVREQISDLKGNLDLYTKGFKKVKNLCVDVQRNKVYNGWGGVGTTVSLVDAENCFTALIELDGTEDYISTTYQIDMSPFSFITDSNFNIIGNMFDYMVDGYVYSVPENAKYFCCSAILDRLTNYGIVAIASDKGISPDKYSITDYPYGSYALFVDNFKISNNCKIIDLINNTEPIYVKKDGTGDFTKLIDGIAEAEKSFNRKLILGPGEWDLIEELGTEFIESVNSSKRGIYLKNGIHIICSSRSLIKCNYTGENDSVSTWLSAFNAGQYGFTLENAKIETSNIRYAIHDERDSDPDIYKNVYKNCIITHTKMNGYDSCIGGGLGLDGHVIIDGCKFICVEGNANTQTVSYHNSGDGYWEGTESKGAQSIVEIANSYFSGTIAALTFGQSTKDTEFLIHGNSVASSIIEPLEANPVIKVTKWNNEIRS